MRIVVLTNEGSLFGKKILNELGSRGIAVAAVVVIRQPLAYHARLFRYVRKRVGLFDACLFAVRRLARAFLARAPGSWRGRPFIKDYAGFGVPVDVISGTAGPGAEQALRRIAPDLLILGQTGIIGQNLLAIPAIGTLNAHPGILPWYRGVDCAAWAVYNSEPERVGVSVHWATAAVDAGNVLRRAPYRPVRGETLPSMEDGLYDLCVSVLGDVVFDILSSGPQPGEPQTEGRQYYKMPRRLERVVARKLKECSG